VAGGVQNMNMVPIASSMQGRSPFAGSSGWQARYGDQEVSQYRSADMIAEKWHLSRAEMEDFALRSHSRALAASFADEILPYQGIANDECPRQTSLERMAALSPLRDGGLTTAALASQIGDGAAALLIASGEAVRRYGLRKRARIHHMSARGDDPIMMLTAPIPATAHALSKAGLTLDQIDRVEINEAFASVVLAWQRETGADLDKVNVNGGAIALGHPLGATGARLMTSLLYELERCGGRFGLQTMCEGGGQANVTILERL
jgi:acetyl-CoA C-acetyltransferase